MQDGFPDSLNICFSLGNLPPCGLGLFGSIFHMSDVLPVVAISLTFKAFQGCGKCIVSLSHGKCIVSLSHGKCIVSLSQGKCIVSLSHGKCIVSLSQGNLQFLLPWVSWICWKLECTCLYYFFAPLDDDSFVVTPCFPKAALISSDVVKDDSLLLMTSFEVLSFSYG